MVFFTQASALKDWRRALARYAHPYNAARNCFVGEQRAITALYIKRRGGAIARASFKISKAFNGASHIKRYKKFKRKFHHTHGEIYAQTIAFLDVQIVNDLTGKRGNELELFKQFCNYERRALYNFHRRREALDQVDRAYKTVLESDSVTDIDAALKALDVYIQKNPELFSPPLKTPQNSFSRKQPEYPWTSFAFGGLAGSFSAYVSMCHLEESREPLGLFCHQMDEMRADVYSNFAAAFKEHGDTLKSLNEYRLDYAVHVAPELKLHKRELISVRAVLKNAPISARYSR